MAASGSFDPCARYQRCRALGRRHGQRVALAVDEERRSDSPGSPNTSVCAAKWAAIERFVSIQGRTPIRDGGRLARSRRTKYRGQTRRKRPPARLVDVAVAAPLLDLVDPRTLLIRQPARGNIGDSALASKMTNPIIKPKPAVRLPYIRGLCHPKVPASTNPAMRPPSPKWLIKRLASPHAGLPYYDSQESSRGRWRLPPPPTGDL